MSPARTAPDRATLLWWGLLANTEALVVLAYVASVDSEIRRPLFYLYPFVWLNVAVWAVRQVDSPVVGRRLRGVGAVLAAGYFSALAYAGGLVGVDGGHATGIRVAFVSLPPGWAPALLYDGRSLSVALVPFEVVGYATLAYLAYVVVLDVANGSSANPQSGGDGTANVLAGGLLGAFSCVSCTLPVVASVLGGLAGGGTALAATAYARSYALSTVAFVVTVLLLTWRPTVGSIEWRPA